ncbi:glycosyltransferase family 4 protein [uncultured Rhodospira sp.]|uniref:glycosyltransferase family 4 protein n=1 Tax=uncultured Rhodospira sp. TaxID=1936189 RepID=UPI00261F7F28|nr:glycosyltransferase family 4 protein [uncultured Rhodospira sp.]
MSDGPRARICLVTTEILGVTRTGGIGTVLAALADLLVSEGHAVTVLCLNGRAVMDGDFDAWVTHYRRRGVTLEAMPPPGGDPATPPMAGLWAHGTLARRWHVLRWLDARAFDLVHFNDWGGEAFLCGRSRRQGLALRKTQLVMGLHGASDWTLAGNDTLPDDLARLVQIDLERAGPAVMDAVWSPGPFMPDWLATRGTPVRDLRVMPQLMPDPGPPRPVDDAAPIVEPVLFGRLEDRKGVPVLLDALDRLASRPGPHPERVTFLGRASTIGGEPAARVIARRASAWPWPVQVLDRLDRAAALDYLRGPGRLALVLAPMENCPLTLHECLAMRVPVLASATGGNPALIAATDRERVLVPYDAEALAKRLGAVLGRPFGPARPAFDPDEAVHAWRAWHRALLADPCEADEAKAARSVTEITVLRVPTARPEAGWHAVLKDIQAPEDAVCLVTDADTLRPRALETLAAVMNRTGADVLAPGWVEGDEAQGRARLCLDSAPMSACLVNAAAGPGLVLGPRARAVAAREWDPASGLWGLVAACLAAGLRHEAVPFVLLDRTPPWRDAATARARAPRLWAALGRPSDLDLIAAFASAVVAETESGGSRLGAPPGDAASRAARRDRRRARALWRSWPWRWTRPWRNRRRVRRGLPPEPVDPPPLSAPGAASAVLYDMLRSRSWAVMAGPRLVANLVRCVWRRAQGCIWRKDMRR